MILDKEIYVIDDFIDLEYQEDIRSILLAGYQYQGKDFPWYYMGDITADGDADSQGRAALGHEYIIYDEDQSIEDQKATEEIDHFHYLFLAMLKHVCVRMNIKKINVLQGRSFLQFPLNLKDKSVDTPHIDLQQEHLVALYYVCDSDGDTIIYNERHEPADKVYTVKQRVTPKQGRMVLFDGSLYHTAEQPEHNVRCVVNYNLG